MIVASGDTEPGERYLFDRDTEGADACSTRCARSCRAQHLAR